MKLIAVAAMLASSLSFAFTSTVFFAVRHGESVPSRDGRVCSSMAQGVDKKNGLTETGRKEVEKSCKQWIADNRALITSHLETKRLQIVSSPFSRTRETAEIIRDTLKKELKLPVAEIIIADDLRERFFGEVDEKTGSHKLYQTVWDEDKKDPAHTKWGVESALKVQDRMRAFVTKLEAGKLYVLVSHGDALDILETAFRKLDASKHCDPSVVKPFKTAEVRRYP